MNIQELLRTHRYFGRGIIVGKSPKTQEAFLLYFLSGRSQNSQNRTFVAKDGQIHIQARVEDTDADTSLTFYPPLLTFQNQIILGNGDQTQSIFDALQKGGSFEEALRMREFEPDAPHFTPRISTLITLEGDDFSYKMSLIKSFQTHYCHRFFYEYPSVEGYGHFLHTYAQDWSPLPSFIGEPKALQIPQSLEELATEVWDNLDKDYKIALFAQSIHPTTQQTNTIILNKE
ncbi:hypothetical protein BBW65_04160 [Helicobacter enhydrae]|uniref:Inosine monophosphate cyclohydrolase-like domain-containing protein n=1 Tax=Helicobacter enhydrae TaxID=222136 RepID=A0A1B1U5S5_9HELI|nr:IMP cyclohydrolase [Helicobacter enhydrae]ANV98045.1 hypothetical protein BBW65_04160 [Helicobacter enhydrae]